MRRTNCGRAPGELAMGGAAVQTAPASVFGHRDPPRHGDKGDHPQARVIPSAPVAQVA